MGETTQESKASKSSFAKDAITSEDTLNPEGQQTQVLGGAFPTSLLSMQTTCDASREPTYFPSSSLEKRTAAASVDSTVALFMSSDFFFFQVYASLI